MCNYDVNENEANSVLKKKKRRKNNSHSGRCSNTKETVVLRMIFSAHSTVK